MAGGSGPKANRGKGLPSISPYRKEEKKLICKIGIRISTLEAPISSIFPVTVYTTRSEILVARSAARSSVVGNPYEACGTVDCLGVTHHESEEFSKDLVVKTVHGVI